MSDEPQDSTDVLRELVAEIAADDYRGHVGQPLVLNTAYLKAVVMLQLADLLERPATQVRSAAGREEPPDV